MEFYFRQNKDKKGWSLFIYRETGELGWIATRDTLQELQELVD